MNDTNADEDKMYIQQEIDQLSNEISATAYKTQFNGIPLLTCDYEVISAPQRIETYYYTLAPGETVTFGFSANAGDSFTVKLEDLTIAGGQSSSGLMYENRSSDGFGGGMHSNWRAPSIRYDYPGCESLEFYKHDNTVQYIDIPFPARGNTSLRVNNVTTTSGWGYGVSNWASVDPNQPPSTDYKITVTFDNNTPDEIVGDSSPLNIQNRANAGRIMQVDRYDCRAESLGVDPIDVSSFPVARTSLDKIDTAMNLVNSYRSRAGAQQNTMEEAMGAVGIVSVNMAGANSEIVDSDMAREMMELTKSQILQQASTAMLAQANQIPQRVLELLK